MLSLVSQIIHALLPRFTPDEAKALAYWIAEEKTGLSRSELITSDLSLSFAEVQPYVERLLKGEPVQYIFSRTCWRGLNLCLSRDTLIPRPETSELVDIVLAENNGERLAVCDVGTGSGCIAIALKQQRQSWDIYGLDISSKALETARQNAADNHTDVVWLETDILKDQIRKCDIVVSNPPYVRMSEKKEMSSSVIEYEPHQALFVENSDPLLFYRRIAEQKAAGKLYFEINEHLGQDMIALMSSLGYSNILLRQDMYGKDRFVSATVDQ